MQAVVRAATANDRDTILRLIAASHREAAYRMPALDDAKCLAHIDGCLREGFAVVAEVGGQVVGALLGVEIAPWFTRETRAGDVFTYVRPEARRSGAGLKLYRAFRAWARARGKKILLGQLTGVESDRLETLFKRLGLARMGASYIEV